jgi:uncharacterized protein YcaQ
VTSSASLSGAQARRIALAAQGFADRRPAGVPDLRALRRVMARIAVLQIDSVNVLVRSHYLPLFSRLGPYRTALVDQAAYRAPRELFEYWGHEASLLPVGLQPVLRWRMSRAADDAWAGVRRLAQTKPGFIEIVGQLVGEHGPIGAGQLAKLAEVERPNRKGPWWDWDDTKTALEWLFYAGRVSTASRPAFVRRYDLVERVLPAAVLRRPTPTPAEAHRELTEVAARAMGVGTERDLRDYFRLRPAESQVAVATLVEEGVLRPVEVSGWQQPAYLHRDARLPRWVRGAALLSPFDSLVWARERAERLFGFRYRLEIYTPAHRREYGYYVLPFLYDGELVARVDLKADRLVGALRVRAAHLEPGRPAGEVAEALAAELVSLASWLELTDVVAGAECAGDLARPLTLALAGSPAPLDSAAGVPSSP